MSQKRRRVADEPFLIVRSTACDVGAGAQIGEHCHAWHQLVYVSSGLCTVTTDVGSWIAPPMSAIWVPAIKGHAIRFVANSSFRTIYVSTTLTDDLPRDCRSFAVSPLLRELILRTSELHVLDRRDAVESAIAALIVSELRSAGPPSFRLALPTSEQIGQVAHLLARSGTGSLSVACAARSVGVGTKTLERQFRVETGMTPGRWRQHQRLLLSLETIASGGMVKTAAAKAGFASTSAYVAAFRKFLGTTPARYFRARASQDSD